MAVKEKHPHYHKNVAHLDNIDVYRVLERFNVTSPTIQHAVKKLLVAGGRGAGKDQRKDVEEAIDSLHRFCEMYNEDAIEGAFKSELDATIEQRDTLSREVLRLERQLAAAKGKRTAPKGGPRRGR